MPLRPKTIRRGIALLVVLLLIVGGGAVWYYQALQKEAERLAQRRTDGLERFEAGDYREALDLLHPVVGSSGIDDFEAAYAYAISQLRTETGGSNELRAVRVRLNEMAQLRPDDVRVQRALIEANGRVGLHADAVEIARKLLAARPDDPDALKALRDNQAANGDTPAALDTAQRYNAVVPDDVDGYIATIRLMDAAEMGADKVLAWATELHERDPQNARYMLVLAVAHNYAKDQPEAMNWLRRAAETPTTDSKLVRLTASMFDALRLFNESQALLERAAASTDDPALLALLADRFWQHDRHEENLRLLADLDLDDPQTDATLIALRALALLNTDADASAEIEVLALREDRTARSWHEAITTRFDDELSPHDRILIYDRARQRVRNNAAILKWTGDEYANLGEGQLAVQLYERAAELLPSWDKPFLAISRELLNNGQLRDAMTAARDGQARAHDDTAAWVQIAAVREAFWRQAPRPAAEADLRELVAAIQTNHPGEPQTLPTHLELLIRAGEGETARDLLAAKLASGDPLTADQRLRLARVDAIGGFGMGDALLAKADEPRIVLERALRKRALGDADAGRAEVTALVEQNPTDPQAHLALSAYLEADGDPDAAARWASVAERFPDDAEVQRTVLSADSVRTNRELVAASIERLRKLTGRAAYQWRLEKARYLLEGGDPAEAMEAAGLLRDLASDMPDLIAPRILLARAMEQTGKPASAIDYYRGAYDLDPPNAAAAGLELVRMLRQQNQLDQARLMAERVADEAALDSPQRLTLAGHLAELGEPDRAIEVLRVAEQLGRLDANGRLVLAELLRRRGAEAEADQVLATLLDTPRPPADAIVSAALVAGARDVTEGRAVLAQLDEPHIAPVERALGNAAFEARFGSPDIARAMLTTAEQEATTDLQKLRVARQSAALFVAQADYAAAIAVAEPFADDPVLGRLALEAALLEQTRTQPDDLAALLAVIEREMGDTPEGAAWTEALSLLRRAIDFENEVTPQTLAKLDEVAERYPRLLPLQQWIVRLHLSVGSVDLAADRALKVFEALPSDPRAAQLAATTALRANRFDAARRAAVVWRDRSLEDRIRPDTVIAEAMLRQGESSNAVDLLRPHFDRALAEPRRFGRTIAIAAEALSTAGRMREARELIDPVAAKDMQWRQVALNFAAIAVPRLDDARRWLLDLEALPLPEGASIADQDADKRAVAFAWWHLAARHTDGPLFDDAVTRLEALGEPDARDVETLYKLGDLHDRYGKQAEAEKLYRQALTRRPDHAPVLNNLAFLLLQTPGDGEARLREAQTLSEAAVVSSPANPAFLDTAARIAAVLGDIPAAEQYFNDALRSDPRFVDALLGLAALKFNNGDRVNAQRLLERVDAALIGRGPGSSLPDHLRAELDQLRPLRD